MRSMSKCFNIVYLPGGFTAGQFVRNEVTRQFHGHKSSAMSFSASPPKADTAQRGRHVRFGRVEDGRGSLGHSATLRFPSPLIEPDVPISGIRLVWGFHCQGGVTPFWSSFAFHSFVRPAPRAFFRPDRIFPSPSRAAAVKDGASSAPPKACP